MFTLVLILSVLTGFLFSRSGRAKGAWYLRATTDFLVFSVPYQRVITAQRTLPSQLPWLYPYLHWILTFPLPTHLEWTHKARGDGWQGYWVGPNAAAVNDMETLAASADFVILDMHGGGFTAGNALMYLRTLVQWIADIENGYGLRGLILSVEYGRLVFNALITGDGTETSHAGGCLVLNLLAKGCECAAAVTISPWTRLRSDASTIHTLKDKDWISASGLKVCEDAYVPEGVDAHSSEISPFYQTSFKNYPPLLVTYGTGELFIEDIQAFVNKARKDQATVDVLLRENMAHKWSMQPLYCPSLQAWKSDNAAIAQWMASHLRAKE
ncbi:hypothetical protein INT44_004359 [Umbelopsis vinacea]|uniref:Alpha/beta hydrolase fold-3 domain-containing protein n=1 Tax=Umbelopsis vinacea TaxID=44442 RepID=A0A8H7UPE8_9FUNG|nr:hypothetical protein INT44_004359 [Umbelopsis vinacea]